MIATLILFFYFFIAAYVIMIFRWNFAWLGFRNEKTNNSMQTSITVSIVVAVRNEAENIHNLLTYLFNQHYPTELLTIIISNDFSDDSTAEIVKDFISNSELNGPKIVFLNNSIGDEAGKKAAIERAINNSTSELIITTDADCRMGERWVSSVVQLYRTTNAHMITGFVRISPAKSVFEKFQSLEFLSLSGTGATSVIRKKPLMCNGANLAFTKAAFIASGGYAYGKDVASGDDTFLMLKMAQNHPQKIVFNKNKDGIVSTKAVSDFSSLVSQRIRWASKVKNYKENYIKNTGIFIFSINSILICLIFFCLFGWVSLQTALVFWGIKAFADFCFLFNISTFAHQRHLLLLFLPAVILYPFYSTAGILPAILNKGYIWKGRKVA